MRQVAAVIDFKKQEFCLISKFTDSVLFSLGGGACFARKILPGRLTGKSYAYQCNLRSFFIVRCFLGKSR